MTTEAIALSDEEQHDLAGCEAVIERGLKTFREVGAALTEIRDARLYRGTHDSFEDYLSARWAMQRAQAYRLIEASAVVGALSPIGDTPLPATESQARELARVSPERRDEVWRDAVALNGGQPAPARLIEDVASGRKFECQACHVKLARWFGKCPECEAWNTVAEVATVPADDGGLMAHAMPELLDEPAGDRADDGTPIVRRNDPALIRELFSPGAVAAAHKQLRAEKEQGRREERAQRIEAIAQGARPLHFDQAFPVIYADPPWRYEFVSDSADAIENHYPTMSTEEICALPVADVATPDAILFLWTTSPKLLEGLQVVEAWGFTYRTQMVWHKSGMGMGYWARQDHEILLIATRGSVPTPAPADRPSSVQAAPKGAHSEKPALFAELIERMFPAFSRLEMFCRAPRDGWTAWGNQVLDAEVVA